MHPDYQRQGLGTLVMAAIMSYIGENAPKSAYLSLIADNYASTLYAKFGFHPTAPGSIGMAYRVK